MAKEGSTISGLMDTLATSVSLALQYGVPLQGRGQQVRPRAVRAQRLHRQPGDPDRQVPRGLHLPLDGQPVPAGRRTGVARAPGALAGGGGRARRVRGVGPEAARRTRASPPSPRRSRAGPAPAPAPAPASATGKGSARRPAPPRPGRGIRRPSVVKEELVVVATNGAANGNGRRTEGQRARGDHRVARRLSLGGGTKVAFAAQADAPVLRRMRLDHGPQRLLLQVPQLRVAPPAAADPHRHRNRSPGAGWSRGFIIHARRDSHVLLGACHCVGGGPAASVCACATGNEACCSPRE